MTQQDHAYLSSCANPTCSDEERTVHPREPDYDTLRATIQRTIIGIEEGADSARAAERALEGGSGGGASTPLSRGVRASDDKRESNRSQHKSAEHESAEGQCHPLRHIRLSTRSSTVHLATQKGRYTKGRTRSESLRSFASGRKGCKSYSDKILFPVSLGVGRSWWMTSHTIWRSMFM